MIGTALRLGLSAAWALDAWLLGSSTLVMTLPYWGVPLAVFGYLVVLGRRDRREGKR